MLDSDNNMIDRAGIIKFASQQFKPYNGQMPKLFNYEGAQFDIYDVMGVFDRDASDQIVLIKHQEGDLSFFMDKGGNLINEKGYLVNKSGDIVTRYGKVLFTASTLKAGEFPKFFPFTRFNAKRLQGVFETDPLGAPILSRNQDGSLIDDEGNTVNAKGYLVDRHGNVCDPKGHKMFEKHLLTPDGDIPQLFRMNVLKSDSVSSLDFGEEPLEAATKSSPKKKAMASKTQRNWDQ